MTENDRQSILARVETLERELAATRAELTVLGRRSRRGAATRGVGIFALWVLAAITVLAAEPQPPLVNTGSPPGVQLGTPVPPMPPLINFGTPVPSPTPAGGKPAKPGKPGNPSLPATQEEGTNVRAPFRVLDKAGKVIALIGVAESGENQGLDLFDAAENRVIQLNTRSVYGQAAIIVTGTGKGIAGFGLDDQGSGLLRLTRAGGSALAGTFGTAGVIVHNAAGTAVAQLSGASPSGKPTGYLSLGNSGGSALVEAGALSDQFGVVRAYPQGGAPPIPIPNFIVGHGFAQQGGGGGH